jgi:hypothetical protein
MTFSGAVPAAASTTFVLTLLSAAALAADEHPYRTQALAGRYRYDAAAAQIPQIAETPVVESAGRPRRRVSNPAQRIPEATPAPASVESAAIAPDGTLVLPKMTVPAVKPRAPARLPQLHVMTPVRNVGEGDAFETPKARLARLTKKYYTTNEQALGRLLFNSVGGWAGRDAAINDSTEQLNDLAYLIELSLAAGLESAEEQKEIRAEYYRLLATKPR